MEDTQFKKSLEELQASIEASVSSVLVIKAFIKYCPVPIIMLDKDLKAVIWTHSFAEEFGLEEFGDLTGIHISKLLPPCFNLNQAFLKKLSCMEECSGKTECSYIHRDYDVVQWPENGHMAGSIIVFKNIVKHL